MVFFYSNYEYQYNIYRKITFDYTFSSVHNYTITIQDWTINETKLETYSIILQGISASYFNVTEVINFDNSSTTNKTVPYTIPMVNTNSRTRYVLNDEYGDYSLVLGTDKDFYKISINGEDHESTDIKNQYFHM